MTTNCVISFDNCAARVFYSGQLVTGRVILTVGQEQSVKSKGIVGTNIFDFDRKCPKKKFHNKNQSY